MATGFLSGCWCLAWRKTKEDRIFYYMSIPCQIVITFLLLVIFLYFVVWAEIKRVRDE